MPHFIKGPGFARRLGPASQEPSVFLSRGPPPCIAFRKEPSGVWGLERFIGRPTSAAAAATGQMIGVRSFRWVLGITVCLWCMGQARQSRSLLSVRKEEGLTGLWGSGVWGHAGRPV